MEEVVATPNANCSTESVKLKEKQDLLLFKGWDGLNVCLGSKMY